MVTDTFDPLLTEKEYRAWLGISGPTAQRQRSDGSAPPFVQLSKRRVGYRKSVVERWLDARTINRVGALLSAQQTPEPTAQAAVTSPVILPRRHPWRRYRASVTPQRQRSPPKPALARNAGGADERGH